MEGAKNKLKTEREVRQFWVAFIPAVIAGVYIGHSAAKLYNLQIEQHAMAMEAREAIKRILIRIVGSYDSTISVGPNNPDHTRILKLL
ncbi:hypothetical protein ACSBR1_013667 [Camellia fascicularis]